MRLGEPSCGGTMFEVVVIDGLEGLARVVQRLEGQQAESGRDPSFDAGPLVHCTTAGLPDAR
jgi:hypothetical protein